MNTTIETIVNARLESTSTKVSKKMLQEIALPIIAMPLDDDAKINLILMGVKGALTKAKSDKLNKQIKPIIDLLNKLPEGYTFEGELLEVVKSMMPKSQSRSVSVKYPIVVNGKVFTQWSDVIKGVKYNGLPLWKQTKMGANVDEYPTKGFNAKVQISNLKIVRNGAWDIYPIGGDTYVKHDDAVANPHKDAQCEVNDVVSLHNNTKSIVITTNSSFEV
tara:strand:+ start:200 stop:856 length:657 start_codon:yes stop_codon:yes gene_type:complete